MFFRNRTKMRLLDLGQIMCSLGEVETSFLAQMGAAVERGEPIKLNPNQVDACVMRSLTIGSRAVRFAHRINEQGVVSSTIELFVGGNDKWLFTALDYALEPWCAIRTDRVDGCIYNMWISGPQATRYLKLLFDNHISI